MNMGASTATKGPCVNISTFLSSESPLPATELGTVWGQVPKII